jgi:hypothetical protein
MRRSRLYVTGASGSGTTPRAGVADWSVPHGDADDYFWLPTDPPYVEKRPEVERLALFWSSCSYRECLGPVSSILGWETAWWRAMPWSF